MLIDDLYGPRWHEQMEEVIKAMVNGGLKENEWLKSEVDTWESSDKRNWMLAGERYYRNKMDIENKQASLTWRSNLKLTHGFVRKLVDQKIGYLLSNTPSISTDNEAYQEKLDEFFDRGMLNRLKKIGKEAVNKGVAYLYPYINESGDLKFMKFPSEQLVVHYADPERMEVRSFIRSFEIETYVNKEKKKIKKVEYYHENGIRFYELFDGELVPDVAAGIEQDFHFIINGNKLLWEKVPLIHFRYNEEEQPLVEMVKSIVDNYNLQASTNADGLADIPNIIFKLVNYEGENLAEFLGNLIKYRAVNTGEGGDVDKLTSEVNTEASEKELDRVRKSIYEFGRGVDTTATDLGNASGVALKYRYSDLDLDCSMFATEMSSSIEHMLWFYTTYLNIIRAGDFTEETANFVFNKDIIINESEIIEDVQKSVGILDDQTVRENHPWYTPEVEDRLAAEKVERENAYPDLDEADGFEAKDDE